MTDDGSDLGEAASTGARRWVPGLARRRTVVILSVSALASALLAAVPDAGTVARPGDPRTHPTDAARSPLTTTSEVPRGEPEAGRTSGRHTASGPLPQSRSSRISESHVVSGTNRWPGTGPPALYRARPALVTAAGWPFGEHFPTISGTGAVRDGAIYWSDFLYDDRGARGRTASPAVTPFATSHGTYEYEDPSAARNGADIFRAAIGIDADASYWRVDWNTLVDQRVPLAVWALDTDANPSTGAENWPAAAGVTSPGVELAVVVSATGSSVIDLASGERIADLPTTVDMAARSFVVALPRTLLPVTGVWRVRLGAGVADRSGTRMQQVDPRHGGLPGGASLYNAAFRRSTHEPPLLGTPRSPATMNPWSEGAQAAALTAKTLEPFYLDVHWPDLEARATKAATTVRGWLNRWYVSSIEPGQGIVADSGPNMDLRPNYLGRVQPYAVYVPSTYDPTSPAPLTWLLHSAYQNHNAYGAMTPRFVEAACEARASICVTPLGRGHDGWYLDEAELDFWEVWNDVSAHYELDPDRTVIAGFSMGGYAAYRLTMAHPDLFAAAVVIGGTPTCGRRAGPGADVPAGSGRCATDGDTRPLVANARWIPFHIAHGTTDELLPLGGTLDQVDAFDALGLRYRFDHFIGQPHLPWYFQDAWRTIGQAIGHPTRRTAPGEISLHWHPNAGRADLGLGTTGAYWISGLAARHADPGSRAGVEARSLALPEPHIIAERHIGPITPQDTTPVLSHQLTWRAIGRPDRSATLQVDLVNVAATTVDATAAGLRIGETAQILVSSDGACELRLIGLAGTVHLNGMRLGAATPATAFVVSLPGGDHSIDIRPSR